MKLLQLSMIAAMTFLAIACTSGPTTPAADTSQDVATDASTDVATDTSTDVATDTVVDAQPPEDVTVDTLEDTSIDAVDDITEDVFVDTGSDVPIDFGEDTEGDTNTFIETPFFQSGFEPDTQVGDTGLAKCSGDIIGLDKSVAAKGDWVNDLETAPMGKTQMCFGGADDCVLEDQPHCQRSIGQVEDPENAGNWVLHTWIKEPAENFNDKDKDDVACSGENGLDVQGSRKARAQFTLTTLEEESLQSFSYSVRIRLGPGFDKINKDLGQPLNWMTIGEYWSQGPKNVAMGDRSRVTLNLVKEEANSDFHFGLKADFQPDGGDGWEHIWHDANGKGLELISASKAPIGEWFTLQVQLVAGDKDTGHVKVKIIYDNGDKETLFDKQDATVYKEDGSLGITAINPIKVYTGGNVVCWLKSQDPPMMLDAWWDDFVFDATAIE